MLFHPEGYITLTDEEIREVALNQSVCLCPRAIKDCDECYDTEEEISRYSLKG